MKKQVLADWICYSAEHDIWWVWLRSWSTRDKSWAEWHEARFATTGDEEELVRAARHQS